MRAVSHYAITALHFRYVARAVRHGQTPVSLEQACVCVCVWSDTVC